VAIVEVQLSEQARAHVRAIDAWWRLNRHRAPDLFAQELDAAIAILADSEVPGVIYDERRSVRRLLLRRSHYHVYFTRQSDVHFIVAVWSAFRGGGPRL